MPLIAKSNGSTITPIPEDLHLAVCYAVYDLGTHHSQFGKDQHKIVIIFELPEVRGQFEKDGKMVDLPRAISKRYTLSLHEKAVLRQDLEGWRGKKFTDEELKGFDLQKLLGVSCQIQIVHTQKDGNTYANINNIVKSKEQRKPENKTSSFTFADNGVDFPPEMPEWVQNICKESQEYRYIKDAAADPNNAITEAFGEVDDLPF